MREPRWFVYMLIDGCRVLYVGKGSGNRHMVSRRRYGGEAVIVRRFHRESAALRLEKRLILKHSPECNKSGGGEGRSRKRRERIDPVFTEIDRVGTRRYAARFLMRRCVHLLDPSKVDRVRQVASGPRC